MSDSLKRVKVRCDCGTRKTVARSNLSTAPVRSCGCGKLYQGIQLMLGKKFGYLMVTKYAGQNKHGVSMFFVKCKCGTRKVVASSGLKNGSIKSCSCYGRIESPKSRTLNLMGKRFGRLKVIGKSRVKVRGAWKIGWKCLCNCGNTCKKRTTILRNLNVRSCGCLRSEKARKRAIRLHKTNGFGKSKSCTAFLDAVEAKYKVKISREIKIGNRWFDGRFKNVLIEVDSKYWHSLRPEIDVLKTKLAKSAGYILHRFNVEVCSEVPSKLKRYQKRLDTIFGGRV